LALDGRLLDGNNPSEIRRLLPFLPQREAIGMNRRFAAASMPPLMQPISCNW
jgi:hypothetical protein